MSLLSLLYCLLCTLNHGLLKTTHNNSLAPLLYSGSNTRSFSRPTESTKSMEKLSLPRSSIDWFVTHASFSKQGSLLSPPRHAGQILLFLSFFFFYHSFIVFYENSTRANILWIYFAFGGIFNLVDVLLHTEYLLMIYKLFSWTYVLWNNIKIES